MSREVVYGTVAVFLVLSNAALVLSGPRTPPAPEASQDASLVRSVSFPSGDFVIVEGDEATLCHPSGAPGVAGFCERSQLTSHEGPTNDR